MNEIGAHPEESGTFRTIDDVIAWLDARICRFCRKEGAFHVGRDMGETGRYRISMYTERNQYTIHVRETFDDGVQGHAGYIGGSASARKPRAGETWRRGNDLSDGPFDRDTLQSILFDILSYELEDIHSTAEMVEWQQRTAKPKRDPLAPPPSDGIPDIPQPTGLIVPAFA